MGLFDIFRRKEKIPKAAERIFEAIQKELEGKKLADEAISYRNLGKYEKAFSLLMKALTEFDYKPALLLIGTTAIAKRDIDGAIDWFTTLIEDQGKRRDFPLIEIYANLGSIYFKYREDFEKSIDFYERALTAPRSPDFSSEYYQIAESSVHRDIAVVYQKFGDFSKAREHASKSLQVNPDCSVSKSVLLYCDDQSAIPSAPSGRGAHRSQLVENQPNGTVIIRGGESPNYITALLSIWEIAWEEKISDGDKSMFLRHMNLSEHSRPGESREIFSHAMLHFFVELKQNRTKIPEAFSKIALLIPEDCLLPPLPRPLSTEIRALLIRALPGFSV